MEPIAWLFLTGFTALREHVVFVPWFSATEALSLKRVGNLQCHIALRSDA